MNYKEFYTTAQKRLVDSMASMWFKGKPEEQEYLRRLLTVDEPLLSEPVFQSIFPWEESKETFGEHASKLKILSQDFVDTLSSDNIDEEYRFPISRHPYKHQTKSWKTMLSGQNKTIVVTSGTGSGKTECFMIPVLQDIAQRNEKECVQAIFLYPLNALMKSQQKRIHAWCEALPDKITYAIYNGNTEKKNMPQAKTEPYFPQLITRPQIRQTPPQVLFTNPTMLNYMLVRSEDRSILEKSKGKLRWILLDEAHTYTGSSAAELSLQLRRVLDAFGVTIDQVNFAVTSATIGDEKDPSAELKLKTFVSQLTGKPVDNIVVIGGKRIVPEMDEAKAKEAISRINDRFGTKITLPDIERLRKKLNSSPVLKARDIVKPIDSAISKDTVKSLEVIDALADKVDGLNKADGKPAALLPCRAHFFIRSISGVYACVNPECTRHKKSRTSIGNWTTYQNTDCPVCKSRMLEVATCPSCGGAIVVGETSTARGFRMRVNTIDLDNNLFYDTNNEDLIESEDTTGDVAQAREEEGFTPFYFAKPEKRCLRHHTSETAHVFNHENCSIEIVSDETDDKTVFKSLRHSDTNADLCPHCGNRISNINYLRASATQMGRVLSTLILDHAEGIDTNDAEVLYDGKKYITFTDNRQGSARSAMGMNQDVERAWIRASVFHKLADLRLDNMPSAGLTAEEEQLYEYLKQQPLSSLPPMLKTQLEHLEAKKNGTAAVPPPGEVEWNAISQTLENNSDFRKLFKHLSNARGGIRFENANTYLKALMVDQFGWIPKRANSLENMGIVRLVYPALKTATCPQILKSKGCDNKDWQDFLKICLDYFIRGGRHYMISGDYQDYLTQNTYASAIYPFDSALRKNGKPVSRWPSVKRTFSRVQEDQSRLVLLLCAVLGYDDVDGFDEEKIANVNSLLREAWNFITANVLDPVDTENRGYMLDLLGNKVKLQLIEKGYLCPVDNVIVDVTFRGYSPRMNGYLGKANFDRFKTTKVFDFPLYPFRSDEPSEKKIMDWIDQNMSEQREAGVFSDINERIYIQKPIFISAEHSAQQSREDLEKYEKEFNAGQLNVLSCSTTMEMGVDIGGISEVVMNNVPPKSANYLQRAGRAGRRNESKAMALTFCAPNPIGSYTWKHPDYPITHLTETPLLKLESRQLIQRHVNALIFADFVSLQDGNIRVTAKLCDFFISHDSLSYLDQFLNHIDLIISGQRQELEQTYNRLVKGTAMSNLSLGDAALTTKKDIYTVYNGFKINVENFDKAKGTAENQDGGGSAAKAIEIQRKNFIEKSLLSFLAEQSFLPSAGIPTGLVECMLKLDERAESPTMHLSQAISSYAPGNQVIKNEWIYEPAGIRLKTRYEENTSRYIIQNCSNCGYTTISYGSAKNDCPKCNGQNTMHGIREINIGDNRFTEVVEPAAFTIAWGSKPTRKMKGRGALDFIQPVLLEMDPWGEKTSSAKITVRCSTPQSEILFYNRGRSGYGFAFCPICGRMESEKNISDNENVLSNHKHLTNGTQCTGTNSIRRHVLLVGRYQTDFVEIKFYNKDNLLLTDQETLYSLGVILSRKLSELLGVNDGEIDFGYNSTSNSIFIYDTALGGAGYSTLFREYKDKVIEMAYKTLMGCDCERACTKCLIDRRSQWYLNYLNRKKALEWIELEMKSRIAPESITNAVPNAAAITSDFSTEFFQLSRNRDIKAVKLFIDSDFVNWNPDEFPYIRQMEEMRLAGVDASFVLGEKLNLKNCPTSIKAMVMSILLKHKFEYCNSRLPDSLKPLLHVTHLSSHVRTYFGEDIIRSMSNDWGNGDLYSSDNDLNFVFTPIDTTQLLQELADGESSVVFETLIKEDCDLSAISQTLVKNHSTQWQKIKQALDGKRVSINYCDRYLVTPLGCLLLAHMVSQIKRMFNLNIISIDIHAKKPSDEYQSYNNTVKLDATFASATDRNDFLKSCMVELVGFCPRISDSGYFEHHRCLTIKSDKEELSIRPDGGIAYGWKPFGRENASLTQEDFEYNWDLDLKLYNQKKDYSGILYTVSFNKSE